MSKFNTSNKSNTATTNRAGGAAIKQSDELALASLLLTSFLKNQYYRSGKESQKELKELTAKVDPKFAAQAAVYARNVFGMRSTSHVVAGELAERVKGHEWAKRFYEKVVFRPDDALEILSYVGAKPTHAMRKGLRKALEKFDDYQVGKYKASSKNMKLVDAVNIVHAHSPSIEKLVNGTLEAPETFETKLSNAGKSENKQKAKADAWCELLETRKIGYLALLRNLRNIMTQAPELIDTACELLTDEKLIAKSKIFPFQYVTAYNEVDSNRKFASALSKAIDISCKNVPAFDGKTLIAIDLSASMGSGREGSPSEIAALFGAVLYKAMDSDVIQFGDTAKMWSGNPDDSTVTLTRSLCRNNGVGHGTYMSSVFQKITQDGTKYDRIFILSDMQTWREVSWAGNVKQDFKKYAQTFNPETKLYSFDLQGYGDMQFPERNVFCVAGWSDKVFNVIEQLESGKSLVDQIKQVEI